MTFDNPFQPPSATVADISADVAAGNLRQDARRLPAAYGWRWLRGAVDLLLAAPGTWVGMGLLFLLVTLALSLVPFIGMFAGVLQVVLIGGVMLGCQALTRQQPFSVAALFDGFRAPHFSPLLILGLLYFAATLAMIVVIGVLIALVVVGTAGAGVDIETVFQAQPLLGVVAVTVLMLLVLAMSAVLASMAWFSPALVSLHGLSPLEALKRSLYATLANIGPFTLLGAALLALWLVVLVPAVAFVALAPDSFIFVIVPMGILGLVTFLFGLPLFWATTYLSYRDVFVQ